MTRRRWIADEVSGNHAALIGGHAEHLDRVLRARVGQEFDIATGNEVRRGRIISVDEGRVEFELGAVVQIPLAPQIALLLSIFKFDRMEWAIEKCTELGVTRIVPLIAQRTGSHFAAAASKRIERWQRIGRQAAEQSRRSSPPDISEPMKLKDVIAISAHTRIVLSEVEQGKTLKDALQTASSSEIALAIGPEGGWSEKELAWFRDAGWVSASLGNTILRAETAAIAAMAVVVAELT